MYTYTYIYIYRERERERCFENLQAALKLYLLSNMSLICNSYYSIRYIVSVLLHEAPSQWSGNIEHRYHGAPCCATLR